MSRLIVSAAHIDRRVIACACACGVMASCVCALWHPVPCHCIRVMAMSLRSSGPSLRHCRGACEIWQTMSLRLCPLCPRLFIAEVGWAGCRRQIARLSRFGFALECPNTSHSISHTPRLMHLGRRFDMCAALVSIHQANAALVGIVMRGLLAALRRCAFLVRYCSCARALGDSATSRLPQRHRRVHSWV